MIPLLVVLVAAAEWPCVAINSPSGTNDQEDTRDRDILAEEAVAFEGHRSITEALEASLEVVIGEVAEVDSWAGISVVSVHV